MVGEQGVGAGRLALRFLFVLLVLALAGLAAVGWVYSRFIAPGPLDMPRVVVVPKGAGLIGVGETLMRHGVIDNADIFKLGVRALKLGHRLKAGEYQFPARISPRDAAWILESGKTVVRRLTVAEGLTTHQVLGHVNAAEGLEGALAVSPGEGTLLPETYHFSYGDERAEILRRMKDAMDKTLAELWANRASDLPFKTPQEALILASIVEKETGLAAERPRIAGVFVNRLRKGMKLQSDPTVIYGVNNGAGPMDRQISRADLKQPTPYNTYAIDGLPPGPICNPGRDAIAAVLRPSATEELYFVADGTGGHVFARSLDEHNRNVARWRKIEKERQE
ncbi:MAG: endolytic transglycosylase MltG [Magnetospirillum sp. WYHS-4]